MRPELFVGDNDSLRSRLAQEFSDEASRAIARRGFCTIAVAGGSVAVEGLPALATLSIDWQRVHVFWADERAVPPTDPESNYVSAKAVWLEPAGVPLVNIHRMRADDADLFVAATAYESEMRAVLGASGQLDFVLLGVGPDGHVASLFPGHPALSEQHRLVTAVIDAPKPPPRRLTMTMPVLAHAERLIVMAFGASKAAMVAETISQEDSRLPVSMVLRRSRRPLVLADSDAASLL